MIIKQNVEQDVRLAKHVDGDAFSRLIRTYERNLYGLARTYLKRDEDCADAVQETIFKAFRAIYTLKEPAYFKTWLFRILINECIQLLRVQKRTGIVKQSERDVRSVNVPHEAIELKEAVMHLDNDLRVVILLHYYEDVPIKQIAELVGIPEGTVKSRLHRARTFLAEELESSQKRKVDYDPKLTPELCLDDFAPLFFVVCRRVSERFFAFLRKQIVPNRIFMS
ncbi:sigma-70 family RNA polymerase sigma factor [Brevibacillus sp. VP]|uniref:sigma-70 family RNA polymerase sigma factor n=1 Tax=unclassified Brevibacillus TaxID=2684853 RepID=UPI000E2FE6CA|nr:sigma-70 family RNA polymerase sigma factor [Brevibacillus sp. VP]RFB33013.1 sigma-70 family RNA polymerase sigma factor [Brevibacillus sp. VP]